MHRNKETPQTAFQNPYMNYWKYTISKRARNVLFRNNTQLCRHTFAENNLPHPPNNNNKLKTCMLIKMGFCVCFGFDLFRFEDIFFTRHTFQHIEGWTEKHWLVIEMFVTMWCLRNGTMMVSMWWWCSCDDGVHAVMVIVVMEVAW